MDYTLNLSLLITIGGILVSVATAFAVVKTKVSNISEELEEDKKLTISVRDELNRYREDERVRIALLERNQAAHTEELAEIKSDIKTTMVNVQEIKEAILTLKKGGV